MDTTDKNKSASSTLPENDKARRLTVMIERDGVDFVMTDENAVLTKVTKATADACITEPIRIIEEAVYAYPVLLGDYNLTDVIVDGSEFSLVPDEIASDDKALASVVGSLWPDVSLADVSVEKLPRGYSMVFVPDKSVAGFIRRTFSKPRLRHRLAALIRLLCRQSRPVGNLKMYVNISASGRLDIVVVSADTLMMANSFDCADSNDYLYYIMAAVKDCGFDALEDELLVCGDSKICGSLIGILRKYVNSVMPLILPADTISPFELEIIKL